MPSFIGDRFVRIVKHDGNVKLINKLKGHYDLIRPEKSLSMPIPVFLFLY